MFDLKTQQEFAVTFVFICLSSVIYFQQLLRTLTMLSATVEEINDKTCFLLVSLNLQKRNQNFDFKWLWFWCEMNEFIGNFSWRIYDVQQFSLPLYYSRAIFVHPHRKTHLRQIIALYKYHRLSSCCSIFGTGKCFPSTPYNPILSMYYSWTEEK